MMPGFKRATFFAAFVIASSMLFLGKSFAKGPAMDAELLEEWDAWCIAVKEELRELRVFDTKAKFLSDVPDTTDVQFIEFESIRIPYVANEVPSISVKRGLDGGPWLRVSYDSGLRILATTMFPHPVPNVFENLVPTLTPGIEAYIVDKYGSLENYSRQAFGISPEFSQIRFKGYRLTTANIDCSKGIEATLKVIPAILASASADYRAVVAGKDVAYWSSNALPGVVTRQEVPHWTGDLGPRIYWSGEFQGEDDVWQVILLFDIEKQEQYDRLGRLLANPGLE